MQREPGVGNERQWYRVGLRRKRIDHHRQPGLPPVITFVSPTPNVTPGDPGGMPSSFRDAAATPIVVNIALSGSTTLALALISVRFLDGTYEIAYRAGFFSSLYGADSYLDGTTFHLHRVGGWPGGALEIGAAIEVFVDTLDSSGATSSADVFFLMPVAGGIPNAPTPESVNTEAVDITSAALDRLIWQLRSS
jgi:hypothetical protein